MSSDTIGPSISPAALRGSIRSGAYSGQSGGLARGFVQCNVVILPERYAAEFLAFCQLNPKPCPLLAMGTPGDPTLPTLGDDIDIRSDVSAYRVFENGLPTKEVADIAHLWRSDFVTFALGCSFSFEEALEDAGLDVRHNSLGLTNPMFTTNIETVAAGRFRGEMVVTMRPFTPAGAIRAIQITSRYPGVHGAPVHFGDPAAIGITDLTEVEFGGDAVPIHDGEVPVFWACGVTPQVALANAKLPICITHKPAHMLVTDKRNAELAIL